MESLEQKTDRLRISQMAENLIGSEIIRLAGEIREMMATGHTVYNFTIGDFDPAIFPIPESLNHGIIEAYQKGETNYPPADGISSLRTAIAKWIKNDQHLDYKVSEILVAGGARPLIHAIYQTIVDPGEKVVFPVPSWNNNHYSHLAHATAVAVETSSDNNFLPVASELEPHLNDAVLLALCSPLNPTGTVFTPPQLEEICDLVLKENQTRPAGSKPLYLLYDQIYAQLIFGEAKHTDPVSLRPEIRPYTIYVDGISKSFAATGVRVGWAFGPSHIIDRMKSILGHIGAWAPKAEQVATAAFLNTPDEMASFLTSFKEEISSRLLDFYQGILSLKNEGYPVNAIYPKGAMYLTLQFNLINHVTAEGNRIESTSDITEFLLNEAGLAIVPFTAFGCAADSTWYRMSVGTATRQNISDALRKLSAALATLSE
jgi:aspartate aminotransferase